MGLDARREVSDLLGAFDVSIRWSRRSLDYTGLFTLSKFTKPSIYDMWTIKLSLESLSSLKKKEKKYIWPKIPQKIEIRNVQNIFIFF